MKTRIIPRTWQTRFGRKPKAKPVEQHANLATMDLLAHPDLARMSQTELADLPFDPYGFS